MKHPTYTMLPPLQNTFFILLTMMPIISQSLTIELIPPSSHESPFYMGSLSFGEKSQKLAIQSKSRAFYLSNKHKAFARKSNFMHSPLSFEQGIYVIKLRMGMFKGQTPSYKSYYMQMDTGSDMIWLQCHDCKRVHKCMPQMGEGPFPCHLSKTCRPIKCQGQGYIPSCDGSHEYCDKRSNCRYEIFYADLTHATGFMAHETFTFEGQNPDQPVVVEGIRFGCGVNQENMSLTGEPDNKVAGLVGLSWGPGSLHTQLDSHSDSKFSYCLPSFDTSTDRKTYLSFGDEIDEMITPGIQGTPIMIKDTYYWVFVKDISINQKRLNIPLGSCKRLSAIEGTAVVVDSGTPLTRLPKTMFDAVKRSLLELFSHDPNLVKLSDDNFDLCYERRRPESNRYAGLPNMTIHFENGATFEIGPSALFGVDKDDAKQQFCFYVIPTDEDGDGILGAYQQINQRIIFDPKRSRLLFKPQVC